MEYKRCLLQIVLPSRLIFAASSVWIRIWTFLLQLQRFFHNPVLPRERRWKIMETKHKKNCYRESWGWRCISTDIDASWSNIGHCLKHLHSRHTHEKYKIIECFRLVPDCYRPKSNSARFTDSGSQVCLDESMETRLWDFSRLFEKYLMNAIENLAVSKWLHFNTLESYANLILVTQVWDLQTPFL